MKHLAVILLVYCFAFARETEGASEEKCDADNGWEYTERTDKCYRPEKRADRHLNFPGAQSNCEFYGNFQVSSMLVTAKNENENKVVFRKRIDTNVPVFLGLRKSADKDGEWRWLDNTLLSWNNWAPGEPKNEPHHEYAVQRAGDMKWEAVHSHAKNEYMCQMEPFAYKCPNGGCENGGKCVRQGEGWGCACTEGYYGNKCEHKCGGVDINLNMLFPHPSHPFKVEYQPPSDIESTSRVVCKWTVKTFPRISFLKKTSLKFDRLDLGDSADCTSDKVSIYEGTDDTGKELGVFCGNTVPSTVIEGSEDASLFVKFESENGSSIGGFKLVVNNPFVG